MPAPVSVPALGAFSVIVIVVVVLLIVLAVGGFVASGRLARRRDARLLADIERADQELATARAGDHGWDPVQMQAAARAAWDHGHHAGEPIDQLHLVQVVDRPGTDADEAVYRVVGSGGHEHEIVLKRVDGAWTT